MKNSQNLVESWSKSQPVQPGELRHTCRHTNGRTDTNKYIIFLVTWSIKMFAPSLLPLPTNAPFFTWIITASITSIFGHLLWNRVQHLYRPYKMQIMVIPIKGCITFIVCIRLLISKCTFSQFPLLCLKMGESTLKEKTLSMKTMSMLSELQYAFISLIIRRSLRCWGNKGWAFRDMQDPSLVRMGFTADIVLG